MYMENAEHYIITAQKQKKGSKPKTWKVLPEKLETFKKKLDGMGYIYDVAEVKGSDYRR